jgi:hypothetical protein
VTLAPRALAPLVFSQPTLWFLRAFLPSKLAAIAGKPADYKLSEEDGRTLHARKRREQDPVLLPQPWLAHLPAQNRQLMPEHENLQLL